jgi:hypothetical protein
MLLPTRRSLIIELVLIIRSIRIFLITLGKLLITTNLGEILHLSPVNAVVILPPIIWNVLVCRNRRELS